MPEYKYSPHESFHPVVEYTRRRMSAAVDVGDGIEFTFWRGSLTTKAKIKTKKNSNPKKIARTRIQHDESVQTVFDRLSLLTKAKLPVKLVFNYVDTLTAPFWHKLSKLMTEFQLSYKDYSLWTCFTNLGVICVIKYKKNNKVLYDTLMFSIDEDNFVARSSIITRSRRADSIAAFCGQKWVYNMGRWYSLFDLQNSVRTTDLTSSVFFVFDDDPIVVPNRNVLNTFILDSNNTAALWAWQIGKGQYKVQTPSPTYHPSKDISDKDDVVELNNGAWQFAKTLNQL